ncbi:hypothetical protein [uncultured Campylobacter sp.]|uniref:hypothetical protein n=1 Tax=uncultured Campylobacter sp. TaxID=218934 RepID=UPI00261D2817|nr:hypothetical protein [uncultured Campylobacter sp.]
MQIEPAPYKISSRNLWLAFCCDKNFEPKFHALKFQKSANAVKYAVATNSSNPVHKVLSRISAIKIPRSEISYFKIPQISRFQIQNSVNLASFKF